MIQMTGAAAPSPVSLEISDRHLPVQMVANRLRADLPRSLPGPAMLRHRPVKLAAHALLTMIGSVVNISRHRHAA